MKKRTVYGPEVKARALVLYSAGVPLARISSLLGVPSSTAYLWASSQRQDKAKQYREAHKEEQATYAKEYREKNKEEVQKRSAEYFQQNKEILMVRRKERGDGARWRQRNREKLRQRQRMWRVANPEYTKLYAQQNPELYAEHASFRRALLRQATPPWLTEEHRKQMRSLHAEASHLKKATGIPHHVDHIIPLHAKFDGRGKQIACGLHVPWNLKVMPGPDNCSKNCKLPDAEHWTAPTPGGIMKESQAKP